MQAGEACQFTGGGATEELPLVAMLMIGRAAVPTSDVLSAMSVAMYIVSPTSVATSLTHVPVSVAMFAGNGWSASLYFQPLAICNWADRCR